MYYVSQRPERDAVEDEQLGGIGTLAIRLGRGWIPALGIVAEANPDALDRQPAAQLGRERRGDPARIAERRQLARDRADHLLDPPGCVHLAAGLDAGQRAAADRRETLERDARAAWLGLDAGRDDHRHGRPLERHGDEPLGHDALLVHELRRLGARPGVARQHEHGLGIDKVAGLIDEHRQHVGAVGRGRAGRG